MKIILLSTFYKPSIGGVERQVEEIYQHLKLRGYKVQIYTTDASHSSDKRLKNYQQMEDVSRFRFLFGFGYFFRFSFSLIFNLLFADFDIIHVHNSHDAHLIPVVFIRLIRRKKMIVTGHNPYIVDISKRKAKLESGVKFFDFVLKFLSFAIDKYIALLESERDFVSDYLRINKNRIVVIPNGIRDEYFHEVRDSKKDNILEVEYGVKKEDYKMILGCLCRMDYVKGIQNLLLSVQENQDCLFIFAGGDGGYLNQLENVFKNQKNVLFTKRYLNVDESLDFYALIDVFLLPSVYEPFGITTVEAMTQGKYILATSKGGPKEVINDTFGEIIDPLDFENWSKRINYISKNKKEFIDKGKNGINSSYKYKWISVIETLTDTYKSVL